MPEPPERRTGRTVGVVGLGPGRAWRWPPSSTSSATRSPSTSATRRPGGLLRFGVPDAKLEKWIIDRRVALLEAEGVEFVCDTDVGGDVERRASSARATTRW